MLNLQKKKGSKYTSSYSFENMIFPSQYWEDGFTSFWFYN